MDVSKTFISKLSIVTRMIADLAVTTGKIANSAVTSAKLATGSNERTWVLERIAGTTVGSVGTYALLRNDGVAADISHNDLVSGSDLSYANASGAGLGTSPSGTWRCMGYAQGSGFGAETRTTLFLRIS